MKIKWWKIVAVVLILPILVMWFKVVHQDDEILALTRNEVVVASGARTWAGSFSNTNETTLRDVAVTVAFLDSQDRIVGKVDGRKAELVFRARLDLQASLPPEAVRLRIQSVQWRRGNAAVEIGPFRKAWEFGYLMVAASDVAMACGDILPLSLATCLRVSSRIHVHSSTVPNSSSGRFL